MILRYIMCLFVPLALFANAHGEADYDIIGRTLNFLMFSGLLYYLIANKAKVAYKDRITSIADKLESVQSALKNSEQKKDLARDKIEQAKEDAKTILLNSQKETQVLVSKLYEDAKSDMLNLEKMYEEKINIEHRHMKRDAVSEILDEMFSENDSLVDKKEFINVILKKVA